MKPPIYPVEVIEVACRALEAVVVLSKRIKTIGLESQLLIDKVADTALRIVRDGLASHEHAMKGEP